MTQSTDRGLLLLAAGMAVPISNLGYANGWKETPAVVENCTHPTTKTNRGNCVNEYRCDICNYKYLVDSGG